MHVLVFNGYSHGNRGDGMIVAQMIAMLQARGCTVRVMSDDPSDAGAYGVPWHRSPVTVWPGTPHRRRNAARDVARLVLTPSAGADPFRWADVAVSAGGGYLYDDGQADTRFNLALRLLAIRQARRHALVVLFSQSIGPFRSAVVRQVVARVLRRTSAVFVREASSAAVCRRMGVPFEVHEDAAFALRPQPVAPSVGGRPSIGATVLNGLPGRDADAHAAYVDAVVEGLRRVGVATGAAVRVISQVSAHGGDDDRSTAQGVVRRLHEAGVDARFEDFASVSDAELSGRYGALDVLLASRLHSGILAVCAGTPVVGIDYLPKVRGVLERAGLGAVVQPLDGLDGGRIARALQAVLDEGEDARASLVLRVAELRESAESAADRVVELGAGRAPA